MKTNEFIEFKKKIIDELNSIRNNNNKIEENIDKINNKLLVFKVIQMSNLVK